MDQNAASAPGLISSLEAMIQASVTSVLDRRLGPAGDTLNAQIQDVVAAALDKRLGPVVGSLGNRMTSLIDQRLGNAVSTLNFRVDKSITAALEQRLGPAIGALTAQITFTAAPFPILPSVPPLKAQVSGVVKGTNETSEICPAEEEGFTEEEQSTQRQGQKSGGPAEKEQPAQKRTPPEQSLDTRSTEKELRTQKQNATGLEASRSTSPELADDSSLSRARSAKSNESIAKETVSTQSGASESAVYPLLADGPSKKKADPSAVLTVQPNATTRGPSSSADNPPPKRKGNQKDEANKANDTGESESSEEEEESKNGKPKRKRAKVKLDPPGYTDGPPIKFRRVSPKLTACAKSRGFPRVVDLRNFTSASNKQSLTMADVVATVLFNYDPLSLFAFMEMDIYPTFRFVREESDRKVRNFVIERRRESYGIVVQCGYHLSQAARAEYCSDASRIWETKYEHIILPAGRWVASNYVQEPSISNSSKRTIEQWATEFGTEVFLGKLWVEGPGAKIECDKLILP